MPPSHRESGYQQPGQSALSLVQTHKKGFWADLCLTFLQDVHLATVIEILQSIRQADMSPILSQIYSAPGGTEALDVLMKYMYAPPPQNDMMLFSSPFGVTCWIVIQLAVSDEWVCAQIMGISG